MKGFVNHAARFSQMADVQCFSQYSLFSGVTSFRLAKKSIGLEKGMRVPLEAHHFFRGLVRPRSKNVTGREECVL